MESCPNFVKVSLFFKRNSTSNWNNYGLYFSTAKKPTYGSFVRDLMIIANHKDLSSSLQEKARAIADRVKNHKSERKCFLDLQDTYQYNQEQKWFRVGFCILGIQII